MSHVRNHVPDRDTQSQLARPTHLPEFNPDIKYVSLCVLTLCYLCYSCLWCVSDLIYKCLISGTIGSTPISRQAKLDQAKPSQASSVGSPSRHSQLRGCERMLDQSTFGKRPRWTHLQQHCWCHFRSSLFEHGKLSNKNDIIINCVSASN